MTEIYVEGTVPEIVPKVIVRVDPANAQLAIGLHAMIGVHVGDAEVKVTPDGNTISRALPEEMS